MIQLPRALVLGLVLLSAASADAGHRDFDADPVDSVYGSVNHGGNQRSGINQVFTNNALIRGNQNVVSFPVNAGGGAYYDARQGGRFVGNGVQVGIGGYNAAQVNVINGYNPYGSFNQASPQIVQYNNGGIYGGGYVNNNAYVGVNPWNGYTGNTYNGYTYTPQPAVGNFNNGFVNNGFHNGMVQNGFHNGMVQNGFHNNAGRRNGNGGGHGIGNGGYGHRWQFRR